MQSQLDRVVQEGTSSFIERGLTVVLLDGFCQVAVTQFSTEKLSVCFHSVVAVIGGRDHDSDHFPLGPLQTRRTIHQSIKERHPASSDVGADGGGLQDVGYPAPLFLEALVKVFDITRGFCLSGRSNPGGFESLWSHDVWRDSILFLFRRPGLLLISGFPEHPLVTGTVAEMLLHS